MHLEFLPLAIVALDRIAVQGRVRDALLLSPWPSASRR
jgi:hypothetical protein